MMLYIDVIMYNPTWQSCAVNFNPGSAKAEKNRLSWRYENAKAEKNRLCNTVYSFMFHTYIMVTNASKTYETHFPIG